MEELELPFPWLPVDLSDLSWEQMELELSLVPMELPEQGLGDLLAEQLFGGFGLASTTAPRLQMEDHPKLDDADLDGWLKGLAGVSNTSPLPETNIHHQVDEASHSSWHMGGWKTRSRKTRKKRISPWQNLVCFGGLSLASFSRGYTTRKNNSRWTQKEVESLVNGVSEYGVGRWTEVKRTYFSPSVRTAVNLKDKWRNLLKAYDVKYKSNKKGKIQKTTQLHLEQPLIDWIRELADKYRQGDEDTLSDSSTDAQSLVRF
ncbi:uncharacterized protein LOC133902981 [Phragmites australis]|uniref:uncharacterized protein LOC133902981 n=1 Tax=Phragmites australis TaxID=29695 RepID=UPI002D77D605|nr:uncharacterized protein LOC133902981 [Phragmites australis]